MYTLVPEKYLPDHYSDNRAYYPEGVYQHVYEARSLRSEHLENLTSLLVPTDIQQSGQPTLSGVRTLRNLVVKVKTTFSGRMGDSTAGNIANIDMFYGLVVIRQNQTQPSNRDILAVHQEVALIRPDNESPRNVFNQDDDEFSLVYPGILELHSGDYVQFNVNIASESSGFGFAFFLQLDFMYDIAFS